MQLVNRGDSPLSSPTCRIHGRLASASTEEHWSRTDAAVVWADTLEAELGLSKRGAGAGAGAREVEGDVVSVEGQGEERFDRAWSLLDEEERRRERAVISIGGGHYAPKVRE